MDLSHNYGPRKRYNAAQNLGTNNMKQKNPEEESREVATNIIYLKIELIFHGATSPLTMLIL